MKEKTDRHHAYLGPYSLEFLETLIAQANKDGASGVSIGVDRSENDPTKIKVRLLDGASQPIRQLYYIVRSGDKLGDETLSRVTTETRA